jgi:cation transport ATPase
MTNLIERPPAAPERPRNADALRRAWYALLLLPVSFIAAFALAGALYSATGHDPSAETPPHWADAVALIPAGIVFVIPAVFAVVYGLRAVRAGRRAGYVPAAVAVVAAVAYGVLNVL